MSIDKIVGGGSAGAVGQSAYEVAVASGFVGTETEWLALIERDPDTLQEFSNDADAVTALQA